MRNHSKKECRKCYGRGRTLEPRIDSLQIELREVLCTECRALGVTQ